MSSVLAVCHHPIEPALLVHFIREIELFVSRPETYVDKRCIVEAVSHVIPKFRHVQRSQTLDGRM
jgi:hypothetical protein